MTYSEDIHIDEIIDKFDFEKVKAHMELVKWSWGIDQQIPTLNDLKHVAIELLMDASNRKSGFWTETGGFMAMKCGDYLKLTFLLESEDSVLVNLTDNYKQDKKRKERQTKLEKIENDKNS
jgi:hypothetical protein